MIKKLSSKKGVVLPLAIVAMLMVGGAAFYTTQALMDRQMINSDINASAYARREAENAIAYAIWAANTPSSAHADGKKGNAAFIGGTLVEITNIDGGTTETIEGFAVKRFIQFSGGNLITYGRLYNHAGKMIAEAKATIACDPNITPIQIRRDTLQVTIS